MSEPVPDPGANQKLLYVPPSPSNVLPVAEEFVNLIVEVPVPVYVPKLLKTVPVPDKLIVELRAVKVPPLAIVIVSALTA